MVRPQVVFAVLVSSHLYYMLSSAGVRIEMAGNGSVTALKTNSLPRLNLRPPDTSLAKFESGHVLPLVLRIVSRIRFLEFSVSGWNNTVLEIAMG